MPTNPGSPEAKRLGCTCPVLDNNYGKGAVVDGQITEAFYVAPDCPIHVNQALVRAEVSRGEMGSEVAGSGVEPADVYPSDQPAAPSAGGSEGGETGLPVESRPEYIGLRREGEEA